MAMNKDDRVDKKTESSEFNHIYLIGSQVKSQYG